MTGCDMLHICFLYNTDDRIVRNAVLERRYGYVYRNKIVLRNNAVKC